MMKKNINKGKIMATRYKNMEVCANTVGWECKRFEGGF